VVLACGRGGVTLVGVSVGVTDEVVCVECYVDVAIVTVVYVTVVVYDGGVVSVVCYSGFVDVDAWCDVDGVVVGGGVDDVGVGVVVVGAIVVCCCRRCECA